MELWPVLERALDEPSRRRLRRSASRCTVALGVMTGAVLALPLIVLAVYAVDTSSGAWLAALAALALAGVQYSSAKKAAGVYVATLDFLLHQHRLDLVRAFDLPFPNDSLEESERRRDIAAILRGDPRRQLRYEPPPVAGGADAGQIRAAMTEVLDAARAEDPRVDYKGYVTAWLQTPDGDRVAEPDPGQKLSLAVSFGGEVPGDGERGRRVEIRGGVQAQSVPFTLAFDSSTIRLPPFEHDVIVDRDARETFTFEADLPRQAGHHRVWIQILQHRRVIQVLPLELTLGEAPRGER
jgi:hypothetical protein